MVIMDLESLAHLEVHRVWDDAPLASGERGPSSLLVGVLVGVLVK
jgi:hypothetical protein